MRAVRYRRKRPIKLLGMHTGWGGDPGVRKGRPPEYGPEVVEVLWRIWKVTEQPRAKRLVAMLDLWLPHYEAELDRWDIDITRPEWLEADTVGH